MQIMLMSKRPDSVWHKRHLYSQGKQSIDHFRAYVDMERTRWERCEPFTQFKTIERWDELKHYEQEKHWNG